jgi:hypothetical protein
MGGWSKDYVYLLMLSGKIHEDGGATAAPPSHDEN